LPSGLGFVIYIITFSGEAGQQRDLVNVSLLMLAVDAVSRADSKTV